MGVRNPGRSPRLEEEAAVTDEMRASVGPASGAQGLLPLADWDGANEAETQKS